MVKLHYFDQDAADEDDIKLSMAIQQGFVPKTCLLGGDTIMLCMNEGKDPCIGCQGPREKCKGRI